VIGAQILAILSVPCFLVLVSVQVTSLSGMVKLAEVVPVAVTPVQLNQEV
jgi:hypothetical protein